MKIRRLVVKNFRGIKELEWFPDESTSCLIGAGDSGKTTILTAIEYALYSGWTLRLTDADFHKQNIEEPIEISVTLGELDEEFLAIQEFGLHLEGFDTPTGKIHSEPVEDSYESVVTIHFSVSNELEPQWFLKRENDSEPKFLQTKHRKKFRVIRLSENYDQDLGWGRTSALTKITDMQGSSGMQFPEVTRLVAEHINNLDIGTLDEAGIAVKRVSEDFSVNLKNLSPGLNTHSFSVQGSGLSLCEDGIPLLRRGSGSRRLISLATQKIAVSNGAIVLIDEIETGLEPFRIKNLLRNFGCFEEDAVFQLIFTTHSPTPVMSLNVRQIGFVTCEDGVQSVTHVSEESVDTVQGCVRRHGVALFSRRILVGEGATEVGLLRGFFEKFEGGRLELSRRQAEATDGSGCNQAPGYSIELSKLGYRSLLLCDSDRPITPSEEETQRQGVEVIIWEDEMATEERITRDLSTTLLEKFLLLGLSLTEDPTDYVPFIDSLETHRQKLVLKEDCEVIKDLDVVLWKCSVETAQGLIGTAAKKSKWFKSVDGGLILGEFLAENWSKIESTSTGGSIQKIISWLEED